MIRLKNIYLYPILTGFRVVWTTYLTPELMSSYEFKVDRAYSPTGPWITVMPYTAEVLTFTDTTADTTRSRHKKYYYKVTAKIGASTTSLVYTYASNHPDKVALTMAKNVNLALRVHTGRDCTVYIKVQEGKHCQSCYDTIRNKVTKVNCPRCHGTGWTGGYILYTELVYINFSPSPELVKRTPWQEISNNESVVVCGNYPLFTPGDLIMEPAGGDGRQERWHVDAVQTGMRKRFIVRQSLRLRKVALEAPETKLAFLGD